MRRMRSGSQQPQLERGWWLFGPLRATPDRWPLIPELADRDSCCVRPYRDIHRKNVQWPNRTSARGTPQGAVPIRRRSISEGSCHADIDVPPLQPQLLPHTLSHPTTSAPFSQRASGILLILSPEDNPAVEPSAPIW